jgi:catechol 2,3-dioxygenase-like lactoylglutathione lyase family enzyme
MIELRACIDVEDLDKAIAFYTQTLGLKLGRRLGSEWAGLLGASSPRPRLRRDRRLLNQARPPAVLAA